MLIMDKSEATMKRRTAAEEAKNGGGCQAVGYKIPQDMVTDVLAKLPAKSVVRFRCVCKSWSHCIRQPFFVQLHRSQSSKKPCKTGFLLSSKSFQSLNSYFIFADHEGKRVFEKDTITLPQSADVVGFANGLACISYRDYDLTVHNLSTHEIAAIVPPPTNRSYHDDRLLFGFDPMASEYKIVKFSTTEDRQSEIFTLGTKKWRKLHGEHHHFYRNNIVIKWDDYREPVCVNGVIYWIVRFKPGQVEAPFDINLHLFDLHEERFGRISVPTGDDIFSIVASRLVQIGGRLAAIRDPIECGNGTDEEGNVNINLWVLEDYHNEVWVHKVIAIPLFPELQSSGCPVLGGTTDTGEILILDDHVSTHFGVFYYDVVCKRLRREQIVVPTSLVGKNKWERVVGHRYSQSREMDDGELHHHALSLNIFSFHHVENILPLSEDNEVEREI